MRVLQIVADGTPGGGTTNVLALAEELLACNIEVAFCSEEASYAIDCAKSLGVEAAEGISFFRSRFDRQPVGRLQAFIQKIRPDLVHCHGARAALAFVRGANRTQLSRSFYTVRGYQFWRKSLVMRTLAMRAEKWISHSVYRTIYVSQSDQDDAIRIGLISNRDTSMVIRNGVRLADIPGIVLKDLNQRTQVAVLGRITQPKNPQLVLRIARELSDEGFVFHFIGGGDLEAATWKQAQKEKIDNVRFHGTQSRSEGLRLMGTCGTFLLASIWEGLPIAPVEAMAMGLAVVTSDVNGCTEVVRDGIDGRVVASEDLSGFVAALRRVVAEPERTNQMIASGIQRVNSEFTRERVVAEHLDLYRQCLTQRDAAS